MGGVGGVVDWNQSSQDREFTDQLSDYHVLKEDSAP
jgi:hypothetical protein